jgi:ATP-dependent DNA ligase
LQWLNNAMVWEFALRFPRIVEAIESLPARSFYIDGEAIVVDASGLSVFDLLRYRQPRRRRRTLRLRSDRVRRQRLAQRALERRKTMLAELLHGMGDGIAFNKHFAGDGAVIFRHACSLGCEGIVSKRLGTPYRSGRVDHWLKIKNPAAPAVKREAEEDWGTKRWARGRRRSKTGEWGSRDDDTGRQSWGQSVRRTMANLEEATACDDGDGLLGAALVGAKGQG